MGGDGGHLGPVKSLGLKEWPLSSLPQSKQDYRCPIAKSCDIVDKVVAARL